MKKHFYQVRIPTLLAFILVIGGVFATTYLVKSTTNTSSNAAADPTPRNVEVANITDHSFTVVFETFEQTVAGVSLPQDPNTSVVFDDRSKNGTTPYYSHIFTISHLSPKTKYSFTLISNGNTYKNNGAAYTVTTAPTLTSASSSPLALKGHIIGIAGQNGSDTLITATIGNSQLLATITSAHGNYSLQAPQVLDKTLSHILSTHSTSIVTLHAYQQGFSSQATFLKKSTPSVPIIALSQNYDFTNSFGISSIANSSTSATLSTPETYNSSSAVQILYPRKNASLIDQQPVFSGTAPPFATVQITIHSDAGITAQIYADSFGNWSYRPDTPLSAGVHTLTIQALDTNGVTRTVTTSFSIFSSGTQVSSTATPSATPIFTPTPTPTTNLTPTLTPAPTSSPTPTPTAIITPTPTIIITPTPTPTTVPAQPTTSPTTRPTLAATGSNAALTLTFAAVVFIFTGATMLFLL